jgi:uncharacterized protein
MVCPKCSNEMTPIVKHGVSLDTCVTCGGIWLDKGELGELMAGVMQAKTSVDAELSRVYPPKPEYGRSPYGEGEYRRDHHDDHGDHDRHYKKKRSIWDIFD